MSPPSSRTPIVNVTRVRSDGFSKSRPMCRPSRACAVGARSPSERSRFSRDRELDGLPQLVVIEVENRQQVLAPDSRHVVEHSH